MSTQQIEIYTCPDGKAHFEVALDRDTVWLSQAQMAALFDTSTDNISLHLKNIYQEGELDEVATTEEFSVVRTEGKRRVRRQIKHYNLDGIIACIVHVSRVVLAFFYKVSYAWFSQGYLPVTRAG